MFLGNIAIVVKSLITSHMSYLPHKILVDITILTDKNYQNTCSYDS